MVPTSENEALSSLLISSVSLLIEERDFISSASCGIFIDYFRNWGAIKKALRILYTIGLLTEVNMVLCLRNKQFNLSRSIILKVLRYFRFFEAPTNLLKVLFFKSKGTQKMYLSLKYKSIVSNILAKNNLWMGYNSPPPHTHSL